MQIRKVLVLGVAVTAFVGIVFAAVPFISSLGPTDKVREDAKLRVKISTIPEHGALEVDWRYYKVFVVRQPSPTAFLMPYYDGAYRLPDPTWDCAYLPCEKFSIGGNGFSCVDPKINEGWRENARWDLAGNSKSKWMPNLQLAPYRIEGENLVLSPEYK